MNKDNQSDSVVFNDVIPLTFRVSLIVLLAAYLWYGVVYICFSVFNMNVLQLLSLSYSSHIYPSIGHEVTNTGEFASHPPAGMMENTILLGGIRKLIKRLTLFNLGAFVVLRTLGFLFSISTHDSGHIEALIHHILPLCTLCYTVFQLLHGSSKSIGQVRVATSSKRILMGAINATTMRTNDILISDSMVSYAKILNDIGLVFWTTFVPNDVPYNTLLECFLLSYPSLVRMKQCYYEYSITDNKQHIYNLVKYSTGLAPIFINLLIKGYLNNITSRKEGDDSMLLGLNRLNNWWYFCSIVSSTYSFVWDIKMDWGLQLFDYLTGSNPAITPLRPRNQLVYKSIAVYYSAIVIDFLIRFVWILKFFVVSESDGVNHNHLTALSTFLFGYNSFALGYLLTEILEILRRWVWVFLKLEADLIKSQHSESEESVELSALDKLG